MADNHRHRLADGRLTGVDKPRRDEGEGHVHQIPGVAVKTTVSKNTEGHTHKDEDAVRSGPPIVR